MTETKLTIGRKDVAAILALIIFFIVVIYASRHYSGLIAEVTKETGSLGMLIYVAVMIFAVVVAPVATLPLVVVAAAAWGNFLAAILSIVAWIIGAVIAFQLARSFGRPLVAKFVNMKKIEHFEDNIPEENLFWSIVFLRIILPVDVLSYALGLFSTVKFWTYLAATSIGVVPFAFIFSYSGRLPFGYQVILGLLVLAISGYGFFKAWTGQKKTN